MLSVRRGTVGRTVGHTVGRTVRSALADSLYSLGIARQNILHFVVLCTLKSME